MNNIFFNIAIALFLYATVWYIISLVLKRSDIADVAWGIGFVLICLLSYFRYDTNAVAYIVYLLVSIWGGRLSLYILLRSRNKKEDFRYNNWRKEWGKSFVWRSFLQVFLLQAIFLYIIALPILFITGVSNAQISVWSICGVVIWVIGFAFQSIADAQMAKFRKNKTAADSIIQTGLWKYSRHPNYFGEVLMWWGVFIIVFPFSGSFYYIVSPIMITLLIRYVSGVPMLEEKYKDNVAFQEYKKKVPALLPRLW